MHVQFRNSKWDRSALGMDQCQTARWKIHQGLLKWLVFGWDIYWGPTAWDVPKVSETLESAEELAQRILNLASEALWRPGQKRLGACDQLAQVMQGTINT